MPVWLQKFCHPIWKFFNKAKAWSFLLQTPREHGTSLGIASTKRCFDCTRHHLPPNLWSLRCSSNFEKTQRARSRRQCLGLSWVSQLVCDLITTRASFLSVIILGLVNQGTRHVPNHSKPKRQSSGPQQSRMLWQHGASTARQGLLFFISQNTHAQNPNFLNSDEK